MSIEEKQEEIVRRLSAMEDWLEKYEYLIELGRSHSSMKDEHKTPAHSLPGCESRVWVRAELAGDGIEYEADSDSMIVRGVLALLLAVLNGRPPEEIAGAKIHLLESTGLRTALSPSRAMGLGSLVRAMQSIARSTAAR